MARVTGVRALPIIGLVFLLIGSTGLAGAGVLAFLESNGRLTARAEGVIVSADYRALIEFKTASGQTVQFRNSVGSTTTQEGDRVPIAYDPAAPRHAAIDSFVGRWFLPGLFGILAGVFFTVGLVLSLVGWVLTRPRPQLAQ